MVEEAVTEAEQILNLVGSIGKMRNPFVKSDSEAALKLLKVTYYPQCDTAA